jgi:phospholipid/cholesterol/gamma-HCH transport system ATP-binding protein
VPPADTVVGPPPQPPKPDVVDDAGDEAVTGSQPQPPAPAPEVDEDARTFVGLPPPPPAPTEVAPQPPAPAVDEAARDRTLVGLPPPPAAPDTDVVLPATSVIDASARGNTVVPPSADANARGNTVVPPSADANARGNTVVPPSADATARGNTVVPPSADATARGNTVVPPSADTTARGNTVVGPPPQPPVLSDAHGNTVVPPAPAPTEVLFELQGVHKAFGDLVLFENTSLVVYRGETLSIIGESGTGKSILLKMMIGLIPVDAGKILFCGEDVTQMSSERLGNLRTRVGYVFQAGALFDSMTVVENVGYALREHKDMTEEQIRERAGVCLEKVNLTRRILDHWPGELSGGMRKRVALARAIATQPEVVLYDEPTQGLDPQSITIIAEMISDLQRDLDITSVLVTHDMRCAFSVSDRLAMVHERGFPFVGTPDDFMTTPEEVVREFVDEAIEEIREAQKMA